MVKGANVFMLDIFRYGFRSTRIPSLILCACISSKRSPMYFIYEISYAFTFCRYCCGGYFGSFSFAALLLLLFFAFENHDKTQALKAMLYAVHHTIQSTLSTSSVNFTYTLYTTKHVYVWLI